MALAAAKDVPELDSAIGMEHEEGLAATQVVWQGALLVIRADGRLGVASAATGLVAAGVAQESRNSTGLAAGALSCRFRSGIFLFNNSGGGDAITVANVGETVFIVDDETVALTDGTGTRSAAGRVYRVEAAGVWVVIQYPIA
jgi:hypothetical protein